MSKIITANKTYFEIPAEWDLEDIEVINRTLLYKGNEMNVKYLKHDDETTTQSIELFSGSDRLKKMVEMAFECYEGFTEMFPACK
jgi:hypothetical protein